MQRRAIAVLRVLDEKHHQERDDRGARLMTSCPVSENQTLARSRPAYNDEGAGHGKGEGGHVPYAIAQVEGRADGEGTLLGSV